MKSLFKKAKKNTGDLIRKTYDFPLWKSLVFCFIVAFCEEFLLEVLGRRSLLAPFSFIFRTPLVFIYNVMIVFFTLTLSLLFRRRGFFMILITAIWLIVGITNFVVLGYRITPFSAIDILMVTDALSMLNIYFNLFQRILLFAGLALGIVVLVIAFLKTPKIKGKINYVPKVVAVLCVFLVVYIMTFININFSLVANKFTNLGTAYKDYGFAYCFSNSVIDVGITKPDGYSENAVQNVMNVTNNERYYVTDRRADIIVVQLESFIDLDRVSGLSTDQDVCPNFNKFVKLYPSGYLTVPAIGAGTANSEFEILTGMKSKLFGAGEYPYKTVLTSTPCESMAQLLRQDGYATHAIHNNKAKFYSRDESYASLGFETFTSLEYMNDVSYTKAGWAKDACLPDEIMKALNSDDKKDFVFTISVQGHGKYPTDELLTGDEKHVSVTLDSGDIALQTQFDYYANQVYEMDQMIGDLKQRLDDRKKPYILLLYGDHIPSLDFSNNPINKGSDEQTEYVIITNQNLLLDDRDLYSYEMSDYLLSALHYPVGIMQKLHQNYFLKGDEEIFAEKAQLIQYDMLYGENYISKQYGPYEKADLKLGIDKITLESATFERGIKYFKVKGKNFTPYSKIFIDDKEQETIFLDSNTLLVNPSELSEEPAEGTEIYVSQVDKDSHKLSNTDTIQYHVDGAKDLEDSEEETEGK